MASYGRINDSDYMNGDGLKWWKGTCGALSVISLGVLLCVYFGNAAVGFDPVSSSDFRVGNLTVADNSTDPIDWQHIALDDDLATQFLFIVTFSLVLVISALSYCLIAFSSSDSLRLQVATNWNRYRWLRRGLTEPFLFIAVAYVAGVSNWAVIFAIAIATVLLNLMQSSHEGLFALSYKSDNSSNGGSPRIEYYIGATLAFLYFAIVSWVYYGKNDAVLEVDGSSAQSAVVPVLVFTVTILYLLFHLIAVNVYVSMADKVYESKEYVYDLLEFIQLQLVIWLIIAGLSRAAAAPADTA